MVIRFLREQNRKLRKEIRFNENKYYVITGNPDELDAFVDMGGIAPNFIVAEVERENFGSVFEPYLSEGDLLIDFADMVKTTSRFRGDQSGVAYAEAFRQCQTYLKGTTKRLLP